MSSFSKLDETSLPEKAAFDSQLTGCGISDADYAHAQEVWNQLNVQTLGQYSDIYLQTDVCLLVNIFETFRNTCLEVL